MKKGIVFFDLDGTLLNQDSIISAENKRVLERLVAANYLPVIASGRSPKEIQELTVDTAINSYVSLNGQYVVVGGQVFANHYIEPLLINEVITYAKALGHPVASYTADDYRINFIDAATENLYALDNAPLPLIDGAFHESHSINMLYLFSENEANDSLLRESFQENLTFYRDSPYSLAIVNKGRSKKAGILDLIQEIQGVDTANTFAFGDGNNDVSMFEAVSHAIAMGNASDYVKSKAEFITTEHTTNGIEVALRRYGLI